MRVVLEGRVVPIGRRRIIPKKLAAVIDKSISPEMKHRYKSAVEMKRDLDIATR